MVSRLFLVVFFASLAGPVFAGCPYQQECTPGKSETKACGNCGSMVRMCDSNGKWTAWSECIGSGPCAAGVSGTVPCGRCGSQTAICGPNCQWGNWGRCNGEGVCDANAVEELPCGNCGVQRRTCDATCNWTAWSPCENEGECAAGSYGEIPCGNCGTQPSACDQSCRWVATAECTGEGQCKVGDSRPCGTCGTNICLFDCRWSACTGNNLPCDDKNCCTSNDFCNSYGECLGTVQTCGAGLTCFPGSCKCEACIGLPEKGFCEDDFVVKCEGTILFRQDCSLEGKTCTVQDGHPVCVCKPDCAGKLCGEDGCGGTCGECLAGETCSAGACLKPAAEADCIDGENCDDGAHGWSVSEDDGGAGGGCSVSDRGAPAGLLLLLLAAFALRTRRRVA